MTDFVDPYLDPATGILRNLLGATTRAQLDRREVNFTVLRFVELVDRPVKWTGGVAQLREIHRRLFGDVYPFAEQLRTVDMRSGRNLGRPKPALAVFELIR